MKFDRMHSFLVSAGSDGQISQRNHRRRLSDSSMSSTSSSSVVHCSSNNNKKPIGINRQRSWDQALPVPAISDRTAQLVLFLVSVLCYSQSYGGAFVFDDAEAILNNKDVTGSKSILELVGNDFWGTSMLSNTSHKSYRPLTVLSFRLNYAISGLRPQSYHLVNLLLHGIVTVLVHRMAAVIFRSHGKEECCSSGERRSSSKATLTASVIFALHPIHTEPVANVVGRTELLSAVFYISAFLCYANHLSQRNNESSKVPLSVILCSFAAMLSKEQGSTVLLLCAAYDILLNWRYFQVYLSVFRIPGNRSNEISCCFRRLFFLEIIAAAMVGFRLYVMGFRPPQFSPEDNPHSFHPSVLIRFLNYNYIYTLNTWLLIAPVWLCFDWSMGCVPLISSLRDPRIVVIFLFWLALAAAAYATFKLCSAFMQRIFLTGFCCLVIPFLPASGVFFQVGFVIADRVLYLPSIGYAILLTTFISATMSATRRTVKKFFRFCIYVMILFYGLKSMQRTTEWLSEESLFRSGAQVCPLNAKVHYNIAKVLADSGHKMEAESEYRQAIMLHPSYDQAMNNLANILKDNSKFTEAEHLLENAISIRPSFAAAWMNLGIVQAAQKKYNQAENSYLTALSYRKLYADCYFNLGNLYVEQNRRAEAMVCWQNATKLKPTHAKAWTNLVILADSYGDTEAAAIIGTNALAHVSAESGLHFAIANVLGKLGHYEQSEKHYLAAIKLSSDSNANYYANLGVLYHRWLRPNKAEQFYLKALQVNPSLSVVKDNLLLLQKDRNKLKFS